MAGYCRLGFAGGQLKTFESDIYYQKARGAGGLFQKSNSAGGVGSIFSNLVTNVLPVLKQAVKGAMSVGKRAVQSNVGKKLAKEIKDTVTRGAINAVGDVVSGENPINAARKQIDIAKKKVGKNLTKIIAEETKKKKKDIAKKKGKQHAHKTFKKPPKKKGLAKPKSSASGKKAFKNKKGKGVKGKGLQAAKKGKKKVPDVFSMERAKKGKK